MIKKLKDTIVSLPEQTAQKLIKKVKPKRRIDYFERLFLKEFIPLAVNISLFFGPT